MLFKHGDMLITTLLQVDDVSAHDSDHDDATRTKVSVIILVFSIALYVFDEMHVREN